MPRDSLILLKVEGKSARRTRRLQIRSRVVIQLFPWNEWSWRFTDFSRGIRGGGRGDEKNDDESLRLVPEMV